MQNTNYLLTVCQQIHQMGKTPSVALVRQYANRPVGIPDVVKALQLWKSNPNAKISVPQAETEPESHMPSLEERVASLEAQVKALSEQLQKLQSA